GVEVEGSAGHEVERRSQFDEGIQREVLEPVVEPYWESDAKVRARSVVIVPFPAVPVAPTAPGPNAQTRTIIECESAGGHVDDIRLMKEVVAMQMDVPSPDAPCQPEINRSVAADPGLPAQPGRIAQHD